MISTRLLLEQTSLLHVFWTILLCFVVVGENNQATASTPDADLVIGTSLPGWNKELPSRWYSGFLSLPQSEKRLHYVFVEAEKPADPASAPVLLWLNGGPGCSSLEGFFYEHGPLIVADAHAPPNINYDGQDTTNSEAKNRNSLVVNQWSWNKIANVIYLEAPAGVGFSYSTNPADLTTGDNQTATDNLEALKVFFNEKFPHLKTNPLYISGESYGGAYVPTLALKIYQSGSLPQMKGFLVGNGVFDWKDGAATHVPFAYGKGLVSTPTYNAIMKKCTSNGSSFVNPSPQCQELIQKMDKNMVDVNWYDAYRTCYHPKSSYSNEDKEYDNELHNLIMPWSLEGMIKMGQQEEQQKRVSSNSSLVHKWMQHVHAIASSRRRTATTTPGASSNLNGAKVPCINSDLATKYLNNPAVRKALHVEESINNQWQICGGVKYTNDGVFPSRIAVYQQMLQSGYNPRILVYNGDVDSGCNYLWAEASVAKIAGNPDPQEEWRPWVYGGSGNKDPNVAGEQLGGFVTTYNNGTDISFATIHGAGHMSPQWRPQAAFTMLQSFLNKEPLPRASSSSSTNSRPQQQQQNAVK